MVGASHASLDSAKTARREFESVLMTTLLQWETVFRIDEQLAEAMINIARAETTISTVALGMLLQLCSSPHWTVRAYAESSQDCKEVPVSASAHSFLACFLSAPLLLASRRRFSVWPLSRFL